MVQYTLKAFKACLVIFQHVWKGSTFQVKLWNTFFDQFIIANITCILFTLKRISRVIIENLRTEISFAAHSV